MRRLVLKVASYLGISPAIAYVVAGRAISFIGGPISILLISRYVSPLEQGYYYTFSALTGVSVLFELGLSYVILVNAAHERAHLQVEMHGSVTGDPQSKARLATLLRTSMKIYSVAALVMLFVFLGGGPVILRSSVTGPTPSWGGPWVAVSLTASLSIVLSPFWAVLQGLGFVAEVERARFIQQLLAQLAVWSGIISSKPLYSPALNLIVTLVFGCLWIWLRWGETISDLLHYRGQGDPLRWRAEIWPMQWRIAVSWASGYFVFQAFSPIIFRFQGPVAAGQVGMTLSLCAALTSVGNAWINTKAPDLALLAANRRGADLDKTFRSLVKQSTFIVFAGSTAMVVAIIVIHVAKLPIASRFVSPAAAAAFAGVAVVNQIVFSMAAYLRAHRAEPFLGISVALAFAVSVGTLIASARGSLLAVGTCYLISTSIIGLLGGVYVFRRKRREWYGAAAECKAS